MESDCNNASQKRKLKKELKKKKRHSDKHIKKHRKKRKYSSSSSSSSTNDSKETEWVERQIEIPMVIPESQSSDKQGKHEISKREDWMNLSSAFPCISQSDRKAEKLNIHKQNKQTLLDEPGQSNRELNPYWKNGGTGLPQADSDKLSNEQMLDATWLKKGLQRAREQAAEEGRPLAEIAAERWGSLESIESMIRKAEKRMSNRHQYKHRYQEYKHEKSEYLRNYDRRTENDKKYYKKPVDNDCFARDKNVTSKRYTDHSRNWKKDKEMKDHQVNQSSVNTYSKENKECQDSNVKQKGANEKDKVLTEAEMNQLGAKIVKAELLGNNELAAQLKIELDKARERFKMAQVQKNEQEQVILTRTDAKGIARPIEPKEQPTASTKYSRKGKSTKTHGSGERSRYYIDDDKYSLGQLYQREKGRSTNDDDAMFTKAVAKNMDMDELFEQNISKAGSTAKEDNRERMQAIKEHQKISKSIADCHWCIDSKHMLKHLIVAMDSKICLSLPPHVSLTDTHCLLTPIEHVACQLQLDEDVWERLQVFKRGLNSMFTDQDQYPIFFETYKKRYRFSHMQLKCVGVPRDVSNMIPMYFKKALLESETEWSVNKKIVDLRDKDVRQAIPNGLSYFMVQFGMQNGYAHVIEDEDLFPRNFAEETIAGILELDHDVWYRPRRESFEKQMEKVTDFTKKWQKYGDVSKE